MVAVVVLLPCYTQIAPQIVEVISYPLDSRLRARGIVLQKVFGEGPCCSLPCALCF